MSARSDIPERWLPVVGYEGLYEVSDRGRVRSLHRVRRGRADRLMAQKVDRRGRLTVCLASGGRKKFTQVHQLVLTAFVGPCPPRHEAAHNDGQAQNNALNNLRWDTHWNNMQDKRRHGTCYQPKGELHPMHVLTAGDVARIFASQERQVALANQFGVDQSVISNIKTGRLWSHITGKVYQRRIV